LYIFTNMHTDRYTYVHGCMHIDTSDRNDGEHQGEGGGAAEIERRRERERGRKRESALETRV